MKRAFGKFGQITYIKIPFTPDGRPKGFAFVEFSTRAEAENACNTMNGQELDGRVLRINFSSGAPSPTEKQQQYDDPVGKLTPTVSGDQDTLFVGNLGFKTQEWQIKKFFDECGDIVQVNIAMEDSGRAKGFAHVQFSTPEGAARGLELNGLTLDGRAVRLDLCSSSGRGGFGSRGGYGRGGRY